ncbi:MAG: DNA-directed RNA polymerase subunit alpha, partial [Bacteroidales bacterium]|nr:DNA-directed RNA polymerase subunit alpha [Bacteroidales bacterium]
RFKRMVESEDGENVSLTVNGKKEMTAEDISKGLTSFKGLNPQQHICFMEESVKLKVTVTIGKGRGWVPAEENKTDNAPVGTIPIDSIFTPIVNVKYTVAPCRIAQKTDYESLNIEITTDGSIQPKEALKEAAKILIYHFMLFSDEKMSFEQSAEKENAELDEETLRMRQLLMKKLSDMDLSVRALNCLKAADIETFADLVSHQKNELMKFRNFGKKSLTEIESLIDKHRLSFGMDISKYNIDKK